MNDTINLLNHRKSIRVFEDRQIDKETIDEILIAAVMAPTAGNQQLYTILRITDPEIKKQLAESCDHQPFIAEGKLVLVFCADCLKWYNAYKAVGCEPRKLGVGDLLLAVDDALIAAQNAVIAAESFGIGSCYIGDIMENIETQREILHLPDYVFPAALLVFGYPTDQQKTRTKPVRSPMEFIVQENSYHIHTDIELQQMLEPKSGEREYQEWLTAFFKRKYDSGFSREMTRSVSKALEAFDS
ncbi:MAG: nitroreductase family protein [Anaerolineaceae bacterium]|nr:nitroreductase family protein [Anaerolineaceae bacterium]